MRDEIESVRGQRSLLWLFLFVLASPSLPAQGETVGRLSGVHLKACGTKSCYELQTDAAEQGVLSQILAFGSAQLQIRSRPGDLLRVSEQTLTGRDGYFDPQSNQLVLRGIENQKFSEIFLDLSSGELDSY